MGNVVSGIFGGETDSERSLRRLSTADFTTGTIQRLLPPALREGNIGATTRAGLEGIGELIRNPGGLSPNVSEAILPRLSAESENIAQQFRGLGAQQQGSAARGNVPVSIRGALESALNVAQERAQRGARREALADSESLRREDLGRTFQILDALLQFYSAGRGGAITGIAQNVGSESQRIAASMEFLGNLLSLPKVLGGGQ